MSADDFAGMEAEPAEAFCLRDVLVAQAARNPEAVALAAPGRKPLGYAGLLAQMDYVLKELRASGIGLQDRVVLAMPNGPEMAAAFLGVSAAAACAPLNPNYQREEFRFYLSNLRARAIILPAGKDSQAREAAREFGVVTFDLKLETGAEAGIFELIGGPRDSSVIDAPAAGPDNVALVLHTSGTTSRPKIVPFTQANLCVSVQKAADFLELGSSDRCLNIMPLFHLVGLGVGILSSLDAGGCAVCTPGFIPTRFFEWMDEFSPTWYTATPAMHQAILAVAKDHREIIARCPLRFIRSSAAPLPPTLMVELEKVFQVPVLEAYGTTETGIQPSCNPLPPQARKPGSGGLPAGCRLAVMDQEGNFLSPGRIGEIVVQGEGMTIGYENDPEANENAFIQGWFRTGDQGYLDDEGYLYITGRIKETINRGGEKISPREVDEVLLSHPDVAQAVTFAVPHPQLGEEVAAAVVVHPSFQADEEELRRFVAGRLAYFKVPRRVFFLEDLPRGPMGKVERISLAKRLGVGPDDLVEAASPGRSSTPGTELEGVLAGIWAEVLGLERVGVEDNFFLAGGNSILAAQLVARIEEAMGIRLSLAFLFIAPTVRKLAETITNRDLPDEWPALVPIKPSGGRAPFFCISVQEKQVFFSYDLARCVDPDQPVIGFQALGLEDRDNPPRTLEDMAGGFVAELVRFLPEGPYYLGGYCAGGVIAFEMARQLEAVGREVALLALFETNAPRYCPRLLPQLNTFVRVTARALDGLSRLFPFIQFALSFGFRQRLDHPATGMPRLLKEVFSASFQADGTLVPGFLWPQHKRLWNLVAAYEPQAYTGRAILFRPTWAPLGYVSDPTRGWGRLVAGGRLEVVEVPAYHRTVAFGPRSNLLAARLQERLRKAQEGEGQ